MGDALVSRSNRSDSLFFYYSGHGGTTNETDSGHDENDSYAISLPDNNLDNKRIHKLLVEGVDAKNIHLFATGIFSCCHSRRMLDLKYTEDCGDNKNTVYDSLDAKSLESSMLNESIEQEESTEEQTGIATQCCETRRCFPNLTKMFHCLRKTRDEMSVSTEVDGDSTGLRVTCLSAACASKSMTHLI